MCLEYRVSVTMVLGDLALPVPLVADLMSTSGTHLQTGEVRSRWVSDLHYVTQLQAIELR